MHRTILSRVVLNNCSLGMDLRVRLRDLKTANDSLIAVYRSNSVRVDYSCRHTQNAYLVRYFPIYTNLIGTVLNGIESNGVSLFQDSANLQVSLIGCGPCPEVVGIMDYLANRHSDVRPVFHAFDLINSDWQDKRKHVLGSTIAGICPKVNGHAFNLCQINAVTQHVKTFARSQLVVIQNCLNELALDSFDTVFENIKQILASMPSGSRFIAIDIINYPMTQKVLGTLQAQFRSNNDYEIELEYNLNASYILDDSINYCDYPSELSDSQIKKKHQVRYVRLVIHKIR